MDTPRILTDDMESKYVVCYADCNGSDLAYIDQRLPEHELAALPLRQAQGEDLQHFRVLQTKKE